MSRLRDAVKEFLYILSKEEESEEGRVFRPNYISSVRVMDSARMQVLLTEMKYLTQDIEHVDK